MFAAKSRSSSRRFITETGKAMRCLLSFVLLILTVAHVAAPPAQAQSAPPVYTSIGDSIAFGLYAPIGRGFVPRYRDHIRTDTGVTVTLYNLAVPGWTSSQLLDALRNNSYFRLRISQSSVITMSIGGNDFLDARQSYRAGTCGGANNQDCLLQAALRFAANWNAILGELATMRSASDTVFRPIDIYNPYVNEDRATDSWADDGGLNDFQVFKPYQQAVNNYIATTMDSIGIPFGRVSLVFNGPDGEIDPSDLGLIAFDGLHPNDEGHRVIADLLRNLGYAPLG